MLHCSINNNIFNSSAAHAALFSPLCQLLTYRLQMFYIYS
ncbi:hypothetical protein [Shigella phage ESh4]|nr:hypothetical protein [Shigella phage ESh4]